MIKAYAAMEAGGALEPWEYDPGPLQATEVEVEVEHCGICHSDLSMLQNEWGVASFPLVAGHEAIGTIAALGDGVSNLTLGDRVGLGWQSSYCNTCAYCMTGDHNLCPEAERTIIGRHGAFADKVRADATSVVPLPSSLDARTAGPLFCAGITVFNPLLQFNVSPGARVGVVGIGGLGHLALQFCKAWGCEVVAFTSSEAKKAEALAFGAHRTLNSRDADSISSAAGSLDLILCTVSADLDWGLYLSTLRPKGRLHFVGAVMQPLQIMVPQIMRGQLSVSSSPVGSPSTIAQMLEFAARHDIRAQTEHYSFDDINAALAHLDSGNARYRIVLSH